jgi:hypothetical protein
MIKLPDFGKGELHSPYLSLVLQTISTNGLEPKHRDQKLMEAYSLVNLSFSNGLLGDFAVLESKGTRSDR